MHVVLECGAQQAKLTGSALIALIAVTALSSLEETLHTACASVSRIVRKFGEREEAERGFRHVNFVFIGLHTAVDELHLSNLHIRVQVYVRGTNIYL